MIHSMSDAHSNIHNLSNTIIIIITFNRSINLTTGICIAAKNSRCLTFSKFTLAFCSSNNVIVILLDVSDVVEQIFLLAQNAHHACIDSLPILFSRTYDQTDDFNSFIDGSQVKNENCLRNDAADANSYEYPLAKAIIMDSQSSCVRCTCAKFAY